MTTQEKKVVLYICTECNLLLLRIDKKYVEYARSNMDKDTGEYIADDYSDNEFDYYLCPECCGVESTISHRGEGAKTLKQILVSKETCTKLDALWSDISCEDPEDAYPSGIPLDNQELKEILVEQLI